MTTMQCLSVRPWYSLGNCLQFGMISSVPSYFSTETIVLISILTVAAATCLQPRQRRNQGDYNFHALPAHLLLLCRLHVLLTLDSHDVLFLHLTGSSTSRSTSTQMMIMIMLPIQ